MSQSPCRSLLLALGIVFALPTTAPRSAHAQSRPGVVRIPDAPTCSICSVILQPIATLGGHDGPGEIDRPTYVIREDGLGRFWLLPGEGELPRVYSAKGAYIGTVGGRGAGPGEFFGPAALMPLPGDSMLIVDLQNSRATVVGADLKPRRTMVYSRGIEPEFALEWPRSVMLQGWMPTGKQAGFQLHRASLAGRSPTILHSFSPDSSPWRRQFDLNASVRAVAGRSEFWSYNEYRYRFTRWSADGKVINDFERDASWLPRTDKVMSLGSMQTPPPPRIVRVIPGDEQRIWSIVNVPSPNWRMAWEHAVHVGSEITGNSIAMENLFDTIIEEIDLKSGRVLSRTRTEKWIVAAFDGGRVATYELDLQGMPRIVIYALVRRSN